MASDTNRSAVVRSLGVPCGRQSTDHATFLSQQDFVVPATTPLDEHERSLLLRYGRWLEALASGSLEAVTPEQKQFVRVVQGGALPSTEFERVWVKYSKTQPRSVEPDGEPLDVASLFARLAEVRRAATALHAEYERKRVAVLEQIRAQLEALDDEFSGQKHLAQEEVAELEAAVKKAVIQGGQSVKHEGIHAVYIRGRVTWDSRGLISYAETHPELQEFRRVGNPSVSLRYKAAE
jgi:hypothetical protein